MGKIAGIILAAGASSRFGEPKMLVPWRGTNLITHVTSIIMETPIFPLIVVLGNVIDPIINCLSHFPVKIVINKDWETGQSTSLRAGVSSLPDDVDAVIIFLADQPFISSKLIEKLISEFYRSSCQIVSPSIKGKRVNPVLFDRSTFIDLTQIEGDLGGRAIFPKYSNHIFPWNDERLLLDIDIKEDLEYITLLDVGDENNQQHIEIK